MSLVAQNFDKLSQNFNLTIETLKILLQVRVKNIPINPWMDTCGEIFNL